MEPAVTVAGVDGCKGGWIVVVRKGRDASVHIVADFAAVLAASSGCAMIAIDMPIGFLDRAQAGGRACEKAARLFLGPLKASSVFSSPVRPALAQVDYPSALAANKAAGGSGIGIAKQSFCLFPKMKDIDAVITPALQARCKEVHPEVSFCCLARMHGQPAPLGPKKTPLGQRQREHLLHATGLHDVPALLAAGTGQGAGPDDILDACVAAWSAERIRLGTARSLPADPPRDSRGLEMAIWY